MSAADPKQPLAAVANAISPDEIRTDRVVLIDSDSGRLSLGEWVRSHDVAARVHVITVLSDKAQRAFPFPITKDVDAMIKVADHFPSKSTSTSPPGSETELKSGGSARVGVRSRLDFSSSSLSARIARPPATKIVSGLRFLLTPNAYSRIVAPLVAQEQHEYFEAIRRGDEQLAWWIGKRMYLLILWNTFWAFIAPVFAKVFRGAA